MSANPIQPVAQSGTYGPGGQALPGRTPTRAIVLWLFVAVLFDLLPWHDMRGIPDLVSLAILFWAIHESRRVNVGSAFFLGLLMDAANGVLIGQHALAYSVLAYGGIVLSRRVLGFGLWAQAVHVVLLLLLNQILLLILGMAAGGTFPGWSYFIGCLSAAALWPVLSLLHQLGEQAREHPTTPH